MLRRRFCLFLCLLLALASLPAWAEDAAQRYDFNGDGEADELRYSVADAVLTLQVGAASAEIALNDFSNSYTLALADLDATMPLWNSSSAARGTTASTRHVRYGRSGATMAAASIPSRWRPARADPIGSRSTDTPAAAYSH